MNDLLLKIEAALDGHPVLTRERATSPFRDDAEIVFSRHGWRAQVNARSRAARGRGSKTMTLISGDGETPETAVDSLLARLPHWTEALS